jgi:hypothetical protein
MNDERCIALVFIAGLFMGAVGAICVSAGDHDAAYDQGQKDALNGKQAWVKLVDADGKEYVVKKEAGK